MRRLVAIAAVGVVGACAGNAPPMGPGAPLQWQTAEPVRMSVPHGFRSVHAGYPAVGEAVGVRRATWASGAEVTVKEPARIWVEANPVPLADVGDLIRCEGAGSASRARMLAVIAPEGDGTGVEARWHALEAGRCAVTEAGQERLSSWTFDVAASVMKASREGAPAPRGTR